MVSESEQLLLRSSGDIDPLLQSIGESKYVLLGEASHGTHEFYTWRASISKRLILEKKFSFIAVEGDWPDCYRINRYVKGHNDVGANAVEVLKTFSRWPTWMWANWEMVEFVEWLREHNRALPADRKVGFYGLDVYSLWESMEVIVNYLRKEDPHAAKLALDALRCFEPYNEGQDYARAILQLSANCMDEALKLLSEVRKRAHHYDHEPEAKLNSEINALVIANAEKYYRSMISFNDQSWNIRDRHMVETLDEVMKFHGKHAKAIVWEHNSHVGDARYTDMTGSGMINVGELVREKYARKGGVYIVGFATYEGTVIASANWDATMEIMKIPPAIKGSVEQALHDLGVQNQLLLFDCPYWKEMFEGFKGHRAIGVVYHPERERDNYVPTVLSSRYDALIYIDKTKALHPLHLNAIGHQIPETYPFGF